MWPKIAILTLGTFAIGTDGFVIAGVMQDMAGQLNVTLSAAGELVTVFAWVYALSSPLIASLTARWSRRRLLTGAMLVFVVGNIAGALANSYGQMMAARVISAIASAAYTPCASVAAVMLAGERCRGRALSLVMAGITVSTIIGVPLGTWLGHYGGFRLALWLVVGLAALAAIGLLGWLPDLPASPPVRLRERLRALRYPGVGAILLVTLLAMTAGFTVYTYIGPLLSATLHADARRLSLVLMAFGLAGTAGNLFSGWLVDRWGAWATALLSLGVVMAALAALPWLSVTPAGALFGVIVWNGAGWLLLPAQQHRLLSIAPQAGQLLISLNAAAMYLGIGAAGLLGGQVIRYFSPLALGPTAAGVAAVALICHLAGRRSAMSAAGGRARTDNPAGKQ
ncbi:MFS transporter [Affinibrenneria salicis]|uniref:MFS transporter n=1 Tax=Affinibrenneria salicis TaxID=2590031 RepID=A0A5J5FUY9_9GAMM|nr:MFS transporter [Affinibrenneria salicis]KAA8997339.1 MFS transporter [Affinibrenneria salicis]